MRITWRPEWYGLDQTVIVGDIDYFYLSKNENAFAKGDASEENKKVYAEIIKIVHRELDEVKGLYTEELSYRIFLDHNSFIQVDAEENVGEVEYPLGCKIRDWEFEIELRIHKIFENSSLDCMNMCTEEALLAAKTQRAEKYKRLLNNQEY
ncbi:hypothetical protein B0H99_103160 [Planomicrobium soli]|uniref:Uncharacterized protein n=1 Tax=Planomicrobium soli TaxID=1176648 RepID=A0A2P8H471_9BACL|nr:hypothetical protein [Planomicrobium soli]PSL41026.1 hypothetical protein B0H99_103160 [Planomicrobium soli]